MNPKVLGKSKKKRLFHWPFQDPKLKVPTIYNAHVSWKILRKYGLKCGTNIPLIYWIQVNSHQTALQNCWNVLNSRPHAIPAGWPCRGFALASARWCFLGVLKLGYTSSNFIRFSMKSTIHLWDAMKVPHDYGIPHRFLPVSRSTKKNWEWMKWICSGCK